MNKKTLVVIGLIAVAIGVYIWRTRTSEQPASTHEQTAAATDSASLRASARVSHTSDPRTLAHGRIEGTVTAHDGVGISDAQVCASLWEPTLGIEETRAPTCVNSSTDGSYAFPQLTPGRYQLGASAPTFIPARYQDSRERSDLVLGAGQFRAGIDIKLRGGGVAVSGTVSDIGGGPVANALVTVGEELRWRTEQQFFVRSDGSGKFTAWTAPGQISVTASADGYSPGKQVGVAPGQHIDVLLTPESVLAGVVKEVGTDRPVAGALVVVESDAPFDWRDDMTDGSARTDADGRFRITRLAPGRYKPSATADGRYGEAKHSVLMGLGETRDDVVIPVHPAYVVTGRVVIGADEPCDTGTVRLKEKTRPDRAVSARTEPDGDVRLRAVLPGTYLVRVYCADHLAREDYPDIEVTDKDVAAGVWRVETGAEIAGVVVDGAGAPVAEVRVRASVAGGDPRAQRSWAVDESNDDGAFALKGLVSGTYNVQTSSDEYPGSDTPTKVEVAEAGRQEIKLVVEAGGSIRGRVIDESGAPVSGVRVDASGDSWSWGSDATTDDNGNFTLEGIKPGEVRVSAKRGWWSGTLRAPGDTDDDVHGKQVTVVAGRTAEVELVVEDQSGAFSGTVLDKDGQPVVDAFVSARRESDAAGARRSNARRRSRWSTGRKPVLTDTDGKFTIQALSPGTYTVHAQRRGGGEAFAEGVELGSDTTLTILATGSLSGSVALDDGSVPHEFTVSVNDLSAGFSRSERFFRTDGTWQIRELPAGEFTVALSAPEGADDQPVSLDEGEDKSGLSFVLQARITLKGRFIALDDESPIPGMMLIARSKKSRESFSIEPDGDKKNITDADGRFEIARAPTGDLFLIAFPLNRGDSKFPFTRLMRTVRGGSPTFDLGDIKLPRLRMSLRSRGGDLGYEFAEAGADVEESDRKWEIALVRPDGPAANSGLVAGDVIISAEGHDVTGPNRYLYPPLVRVSEGTKVTLGLEREASVEIIAGPPL